MKSLIAVMIVMITLGVSFGEVVVVSSWSVATGDLLGQPDEYQTLLKNAERKALTEASQKLGGKIIQVVTKLVFPDEAFFNSGETVDVILTASTEPVVKKEKMDPMAIMGSAQILDNDEDQAKELAFKRAVAQVKFILKTTDFYIYAEHFSRTQGGHMIATLEVSSKYLPSESREPVRYFELSQSADESRGWGKREVKNMKILTLKLKEIDILQKYQHKMVSIKMGDEQYFAGIDFHNEAEAVIAFETYTAIEITSPVEVNICAADKTSGAIFKIVLK